jgi:hypothetical protein
MTTTPVLWHPAHADAPDGWDPGRRPGTRKPSTPITRDMLEGDDPARFAARLAWMDGRPRRIASVASSAVLLHDALSRLSMADACAADDGRWSPRMLVRHVMDGVCGKARHQHCHAVPYRSLAADACLSAGGLYRPPRAIVHFEHTIPGAVLAPMMWTLVRDGTLPRPVDLLDWILSRTVVAALHVSDVSGTSDAALNARRTIAGLGPSAWTDRHPDLPAGSVIGDATRPFLRYAGTGLSIVDMLDGEILDIGTYTIADHAAKVSTLPIYDAKRYFP